MSSTQNKEFSSSVYAEVINSTKEKPKLNIDGFLYVKNKDRDDLHYWVCEREGQKENAIHCKGNNNLYWRLA